MPAFETRSFAKWARKVRLDDATPAAVALAIGRGAFEADLGGGVIKKRMAPAGRGKSGGARTIVAY